MATIVHGRKQPAAQSKSKRAPADAWTSDAPLVAARRLFAELWGTYLTVMATTVAAVLFRTDPGHIGVPAAAAAAGLMVMVVIYFEGDVSGAHLNPAVTLAFAVRGNFPWRRTPGYLVAQLAGALAAGASLALLFGAGARLGGTQPGPGVSPLEALAIEAVLTAALTTTILGTASRGRIVGPNAALAVGGYVIVAKLGFMQMTGASMNPFRSLAPAVLSGDLGQVWIYLAGPLLGALAGVGAEWLLKGPPSEEGDKAAQGEGG